MLYMMEKLFVLYGKEHKKFYYMNKKYIIEFRKDDMIGGLEFTPTSENRQINMTLKQR